MNVSLPAGLESWIQERVNSGRYNSRSEVVREALRLLEEREKLREWKLERLRALIKEGLESGEASEWDVEEFLEDAHAQLDKSNRDAK